MTRLGLSVGAVCCLIGCSSRTLDLDHDPATGPAPTTIDGLPELSPLGISGVWVDDQRLYWVRGAGVFQSCLKEDCEHTQLSYTTGDKALSVAVDAERVYWNAEGSAALFSSLNDQTTPTLVTQDPSLTDAIFANDGYVYWSSEYDLYRCPATGCVGPPELVVAGSTARSMLFDQARAYWINRPDLGVWSAPLDRSEPPAPVFDEQQTHTSTFNFALEGRNLYWTYADAIVYRCEVANCSDSQTLVVRQRLASIDDIKINGSRLYWLERGTIYSCQSADCKEVVAIASNVAEADRLDGLPHFAVDATDIYWIEERDQTVKLSISAVWAGKAIRRTPK